MESTSIPSPKKLQYLIIGVLVLLLATLIGGYIYYGMQLATTDPLAEVPADALVPKETNDEKQAIIDALQQPAPDTKTPEERQVIIESLQQPASDSMTVEEKQAILDDLQNN